MSLFWLVSEGILKYIFSSPYFIWRLFRLFRLPEDFVCTAYTCAVSNREWRQQSCDVEADPAVSNSWKPGAHCEAIWPANGRWHPAKEWRVCLKAYRLFLIWRYKVKHFVKVKWCGVSTNYFVIRSTRTIILSGVPQFLQCCGTVCRRQVSIRIRIRSTDPYPGGQK